MLALLLPVVFTACGSDDSSPSSKGGAGSGPIGSCAPNDGCQCSDCIERCMCLGGGDRTSCQRSCASGTGGAAGAGVGGASGTGPGATGGTGGVSGTSGTGGSSGTGVGGTNPGDPPLPAAVGPCPNFTEGMQTFTANGEQRQAQIWIDTAAAAQMDGPLVVYWYATGGQPSQAAVGVGTAGINRIKAAGGIVVAPVHNNTGTFPWITNNTGKDYVFMDEIIGCAKQKVGFDARHIHTLGMSAGGLFTSQISFARSSYMASVAVYSGGGGGNFQEPNNKFAAMIFHGGPNDMVVVNFQMTSIQYYDALKAAGHFAFVCNHGRGHTIPTDAVPSVIEFFFAHPYGTNPSPYQGGLPAGFPSYCTL